MSKQKGKDKKPEYYDQLERNFEQQKRQLLDATFTLKKTQERLNFLNQENHRLERQREIQYQIFNEKLEELNIKNETNQKRLLTMRNDLTNAQVQNKKLTNSLNFLEKTLNDQRDERKKQREQSHKTHQFQISKYENNLTDYKLYMNQRDNRQRQINELVQAKQLQVAHRIREVADKEREKVQATDKIRDEMGNKMREMRHNLMSLKKEELETTTRLTMLQNHQLTNQLQYQSKQTQKLENIVIKLKQDIEIHKQVQDQLAKRSHISKGIIKKLHGRICELQQELAQERDSFKNSKQVQVAQKRNDKNRVIVQAIDRELQRTDKKYAQLMSRFEGLKKEKQQIQYKWQASQKNKASLLNILLRSYEDLSKEESLSKYENNKEISLNLSNIKATQVQNWSIEQLRAVISILITACQPFINKGLLQGPQFKKIAILTQNQKEKQPQCLPKLFTQRQKNRIIQSASQSKLPIDDVCLQASQDISKQKYGLSIATRMVTGKVRQWGKPVTSKSSGLSRKYKLSCSYRT